MFLPSQKQTTARVCTRHVHPCPWLGLPGASPACQGHTCRHSRQLQTHAHAGGDAPRSLHQQSCAHAHVHTCAELPAGPSSVNSHVHTHTSPHAHSHTYTHRDLLTAKLCIHTHRPPYTLSWISPDCQAVRSHTHTHTPPHIHSHTYTHTRISQLPSCVHTFTHPRIHSHGSPLSICAHPPHTHTQITPDCQAVRTHVGTHMDLP